MLKSRDSERSEIERFLRQGTPQDWITFDESMRTIWYGEDHGANQPWWRRVWRAMRAEQADATDLLAVGLASMDRDGRVREAAIRRLAADPDSLVGPFLALRTADWVDEVRSVAVTVLADRIANDSAVLIASAPLLFALSDRRRRSGIELTILERAAADKEVRAALLVAADSRTRRCVIAHQAVREAASLDELIGLVRTDPDTVVSSAAGVEAVSRTATVDDTGAVLDSLLAGPAPVRRAVLDTLANRSEGRASAERHLFDRSPGVRAAAQRAFRRSGGDPASVYRAAYERNEHVPTAVTEMALIGSSADHETVLRSLHADDASTRRAAVNACRWVASERLAELITPLLWDLSAGVTRAVVRRLRAKASDLDSAMLLELAAAPQSHNRRAAHRLMRARSALERLEADLIALADEDKHVRRNAGANLRSWLHRGAASASRGDLPTRQRLSQRLKAVEHLLRPDDVALIRFHAGLRPQDLVLGKSDA